MGYKKTPGSQRPLTRIPGLKIRIYITSSGPMAYWHLRGMMMVMMSFDI